MSQASDYLEKKILDHLFGKSTFTAPANIYVALCTSAPVDSDTGTTLASKEATYTGYARKQTAAADWNAAGATNGTTDNANAITFAACTGGSSTITHFALVDASTNGNLLTYGAVSPNLSVSNGITPEFAAGQLTTVLG